MQNVLKFSLVYFLYKLFIHLRVNIELLNYHIDDIFTCVPKLTI